MNDVSLVLESAARLSALLLFVAASSDAVRTASRPAASVSTDSRTSPTAR